MVKTSELTMIANGMIPQNVTAAVFRIRWSSLVCDQPGHRMMAPMQAVQRFKLHGDGSKIYIGAGRTL